MWCVGVGGFLGRSVKLVLGVGVVWCSLVFFLVVVLGVGVVWCCGVRVGVLVIVSSLLDPISVAGSNIGFLSLCHRYIPSFATNDCFVLQHLIEVVGGTSLCLATFCTVT